MIQLVVRKVGNSLGITLPAKAAQVLGVREGDKLFLFAAPGGFRLTHCDSSLAGTMHAAEGFLRRYRSALRDLAD